MKKKYWILPKEMKGFIDNKWVNNLLIIRIKRNTLNIIKKSAERNEVSRALYPYMSKMGSVK
jgi:hypothetical protein